MNRLLLLTMLIALLLAACRSGSPSPAAPTLPTVTPTLTPDQLTGRAVKATGDPAVYLLMDDGTLRHIRDWATFLALGYGPGDVIELPPEALAGYAPGAPITRWVMSERGGPVYFLRRGRRYRLPDETTLTMTGGSTADVVLLPDDVFSRFPLADDPITLTDTYTPPPPAILAVAWLDGGLWIIDDADDLRQWDGTQWQPGDSPVPLYPGTDHATAPDGTIWLAGANRIGRDGGPVYTAFDHPLLLDQFDAVVIDEAGNPWFVGRRRVIHFDGAVWTAIDYESGETQGFDPTQPPDLPAPDFPDPRADYTAWLQTWPRPERDNGRCMHYLQYPAGDSFEVWEQITRLEQIGARWVLVNYTDRTQLFQMAPLFARAGIMVLWRPFVRPYEDYDHWAEDVRFLRSLGLPPYIQVYNEPSLAGEWDGQPVDQAAFLDHLAPAVKAVYDAGGFPGLQTINPDWTRAILQRLKADGLDTTFDRLWYAAHMYGGNHPPEYDADIYSVIGGFQAEARAFEDEIGFVPPFIAGEGGWRIGEAGDTRYPAITEDLHRDYYVTVFEWFRTGALSNGDPLPDTVFAFCPWLISDPYDPAAWWDSASGDRTPTIQAVGALPEFTRRFSWDEKR